jgi:type II secretory pathway pseudopilin PulG
MMDDGTHIDAGCCIPKAGGLEMAITMVPGRRFTLVELLVVIGVIAVLCALLFPALAKAKETANRIVCTSGTRQVFLGCLSYAQDYEGYFPNNLHGLGNGYGFQTVLIDNKYLVEKLFTRSGGCPHGPDTFRTFVGDPIRSASLAGTGNEVVTSYGLNGILQSGFGSYRPGIPYWDWPGGAWARYGPQRLRMRRLKYGSTVGVVFCSPVYWDVHNSGEGMWRSLWHTIGYCQNGTWDFPDPKKRRHGGKGLPVTAADGHARFLSASEITGGAAYVVAGTAPWVSSTYTPVTFMDYSFRYMYRTENSIDD